VGPSNKNIYVATGQAIKSTAQVLLPFDKVKQSARIAELVPHLKQNSLVSVGKLADAGYTTVFLPHNEGVRVLDNDDNGRMNGEPVIQGWREENGSRLWRISTAATDAASDGFFVSDADAPCELVSITEVNGNVYDLPSTEEVIRYHHASLGFPAKATLLKAIRYGNLASFP
jgi:hypothetical protein